MEKLSINGKTFWGYKVPTKNASLLVITAPNGMLACGYVKVETADKLKDAVSIVTGVNSYSDMLSKGVVAVSEEAANMGVEIGMTGKEALLKMS